MTISIRYSEVTHDQLIDLINKDKSFEITDLENNMDNAVEKVEAAMKSCSKKTRVYTAGRSAAVAAAAIPTGVTQVTGLAAGIGILAHNFATYNPNYLIAKHMFDKKLSVTFKKIEMKDGKKKSRWELLKEIGKKAQGCLEDFVEENQKKMNDKKQ